MVRTLPGVYSAARRMYLLLCGNSQLRTHDALCRLSVSFHFIIKCREIFGSLNINSLGRRTHSLSASAVIGLILPNSDVCHYVLLEVQYPISSAGRSIQLGRSQIQLPRHFISARQLSIPLQCFQAAFSGSSY